MLTSQQCTVQRLSTENEPVENVSSPKGENTCHKIICDFGRATETLRATLPSGYLTKFTWCGRRPRPAKMVPILPPPAHCNMTQQLRNLCLRPLHQGWPGDLIALFKCCRSDSPKLRPQRFCVILFPLEPAPAV